MCYYKHDRKYSKNCFPIWLVLYKEQRVRKQEVWSIISGDTECYKNCVTLSEVMWSIGCQYLYPLLALNCLPTTAEYWLYPPILAPDSNNQPCVGHYYLQYQAKYSKNHQMNILLSYHGRRTETWRSLKQSKWSTIRS